MGRKDTRVVAIIQARMTSTRLPGKVLQDLAGQPMLARVVNRTLRAKTLSAVVVATTEHPADDVIVDICQKRGWPFFRGSEKDVLDRYYRTALAFRAAAVARITSDCPLIEPEIIDRVVQEFLSHPEADYASNVFARTFPRGLDVEVVRFTALKKAWQEDSSPASREHVTAYIWRNPGRFKIHSVTSDTDYSYMRWTVDTIEDLTLVRQIYDYFKNDTFTWRDVLKLLQMHPEYLGINQSVKQKAV